MKWLRLFLGSVIVYMCVAVIHACSPAGRMLTSAASGSGGGGGAMTMSGGGGAKVGSGGHGGNHGTGGMMNPVGDADAEESGSRIKAMRYVGSDGSKQFHGWYDTQIKAMCLYRLMSDGVTHCAPGSSFSSGLFTDSSCTSNVVEWRTVDVACAPTFAIRSGAPQVASICADLYQPNPYRVYSVTQVHVGSVYTKSAASCVVAAPVAGITYYDTGAELPPSMFVAAAVERDP